MLDMQMCCATDIGAIRKSNQDSVAVFPSLNMVALADGMGGHLAGEVASRMAIELVRDATIAGLGLHEAIMKANAEIYRLSENNSEYSGMGTTLVAARFDGLKIQIANVGDSRLYRLRRKNLTQLTTDQTVAQELRDQRLEHRNGKHISSFEHVLTNALGIQKDCDVAITNDVVQPEDIYLLCSDGLTGVLSDDYLHEMFRNRIDPLDGMGQKLISAAIRSASQDNISVALVHAELESLDQSGLAALV